MHSKENIIADNFNNYFTSIVFNLGHESFGSEMFLESL